MDYDIKSCLEKYPFWKKLPDSEREKMLTASYVKSYKKGEIIHAKDSECLGLIRILSGEIRTFLISEDGKEVTLYYLKEGNIEVLSASCVVNQISFETQLIAEKDCDILVVPSTYLASAKEDNINIRSFLYETVSERFSDVMQTIQEVMFLRIDQRIANFLLEEQEETGKFELEMTQEKLAKRINSVREVVTRVTGRMAEDGIIEVRRGTIKILDLKKLYAISGK